MINFGSGTIYLVDKRKIGAGAWLIHRARIGSMRDVTLEAVRRTRIEFQNWYYDTLINGVGVGEPLGILGSKP